jgi:hypothetical protein
VSCLQLLFQCTLDLNRREVEPAQPTNAAAIVGADRFKTLPAGEQQHDVWKLLVICDVEGNRGSRCPLCDW